ncbi:MAG: transglutaminase domain-containing protein [Planctomycetota bacterium]|nr:transglutaminase domain-containing protein [Planctomycetota bacterium]
MARRTTLLVLVWLLAACGQAYLEPQASSRHVELDMQAELAAAGGVATIWLPVPVSEEWQELGPLRPRARGGPIVERYDEIGNRMISVTGTAPLAISYKVTVRRYRVVPATESFESGSLPTTSRWAEAARLAPTRPLHREALLATGREPTVLGKARILYGRVLDELAFSAPGGAGRNDKGWGKGDLAWIRRTKSGNAIDFHALFIAYCQSLGIPAALELGPTLPPTRSRDWCDVTEPHAWCRFFVPGMRWQPVDLYEAKQHAKRRTFCFGGLTEDRVRLSIGRDLYLLPAQGAGPLNVFDRPYAERAGKDVSGELRWRLRFRDLD